jgi:hypothetical protein
MFEKNWFWFWIVGILVVLGAVVLPGAFSKEARLERRRRKSHSRLRSKTNRPSVRFSVKVPREKESKKRN